MISLATGVLPSTKLPSLLGELSGWSYGLGYKIEPLSLQYPDVIGTSPDGEKSKQVDCSGFVRWAVYHLTGGQTVMPDGSAVQHDWAQSQGLKLVRASDGHNVDGVLRIAFLTPSQGGGIGHVLLICDGVTYESHGNGGPGSREWGSEAFMGQMFVYVLAEASA